MKADLYIHPKAQPPDVVVDRSDYGPNTYVRFWLKSEGFNIVVFLLDGEQLSRFARSVQVAADKLIAEAVSVKLKTGEPREEGKSA